jgi:SAM-dependent methyltransferase
MDSDLRQYTTIDSCVICEATSLDTIYHAGNMCLTGYFPLSDEPNTLATPITLCICKQCSNIQMREKVNPELMFRDYWYRSSTTNTMKSHLSDLIKPHIKKENFLLDIGCNDGSLMAMAKDFGMNVFGVDPSNAIKDAPVELKDKIINDFFNNEVAELYIKKNIRFDLITAVSMFYDVPEPVNFLNSISSILNKEGKVLIEVNYAKYFFERKNIDMLGQEHLIYYSIASFEKILDQTDMFLNDAYLTEMNGGNITFILSKNNITFDRLVKLKNEERIWFETYNFYKFQTIVDSEFSNFRNYLVNLKSQCKTIKILGASTRGAFIAQLLNLDSTLIDSAVDLQVNKKNRRMPGTDIQIELDENHEPPNFYLVMPYQFKNEIIKRYNDFMLHGGGLIFYRDKYEVFNYDKNSKKITSYNIFNP